MKLTLETPYGAPHEMFHAKMACFDWVDGDKSIMYKASHLDEDVSSKALLKEAQKCLAQAQSWAKCDRTVIRDLNALIWYCERDINLPKVPAMIKEVVDLAFSYGMDYADFMECIKEAKKDFNERQEST